MNKYMYKCKKVALEVTDRSETSSMYIYIYINKTYIHFCCNSSNFAVLQRVTRHTFCLCKVIHFFINISYDNCTKFPKRSFTSIIWIAYNFFHINLLITEPRTQRAWQRLLHK